MAELFDRENQRYITQGRLPKGVPEVLVVPPIIIQERSHRLMNISNRLPIEVMKEGNEWIVRETIGGMVTGVLPIMTRTEGRWYGYAGNIGAEGAHAVGSMSKGAYSSFLLPPEDYAIYYGEIANRALWPPFHNSPRYAHIDHNFDHYWEVYECVNRQFAKVALRDIYPDDRVIVHDYHLIPFATQLRDISGPHRELPPLAFFLHIPFPEIDSLDILPNAAEIVRQMLAFDYLGFHTHDYTNRFNKAVRHFVPEARVVRTDEGTMIDFRGRTIRIGAHPISIDTTEITTNLESYKAKGAELRKNMGNEGKILFADAGRADHTKGTHETLKAFDTFLTLHPELRDKVSFALVLAPSRENLPEYQEYNRVTQNLIKQINAKYSINGEPVIHFIRGLPREELLSLLSVTDIALIAPHADGMNLVAKEYMVAGPDDGILVLGQNTGAAQELYDSAILVNPIDIVAYATTIHEVIRMKTLATEEVRARKKLGKAIVKENNAMIWADSLISAAFPD